MRVKIFWQENCPNCPPAKELGKKLVENGHDVQYFDIKDSDGLTEAIMFDIMTTPAIVVADDSNKEIQSFLDNVPSFDEVEGLLVKN